MAKNNNKKGTKPQNKTMPTPPVDTTTEQPTVAQEEAMTTELAEATFNQLAKGIKGPGLDANHMVDLNGQLIELFVKNERSRNLVSIDLAENMTRIAQIGAITAVAEAVVRGDSMFALAIQKSAYPQLKAAAEELGVKMPTLNALPAPDAKGNVQITSSEIKVSKETKAQVEKEQKVQQEGDEGKYEMDPVKLVEQGEEELKKSINYLFLSNTKKKGSSLSKLLHESVEFIKKFRFAEADRAENKDEAKKKLESRSMFEWMEDVMSFIDPSLYLLGVCKATVGAMISSGSPLTAFTTFRSMLLTNTDANFSWTDQDCVDALCAIVRWEISNRIAAEEAGKAALDKKARGYRESATVFDNKIAELNGYLTKLSNPDFDIVEKFGTVEGDEDGSLSGAARIITKIYYADCKPEGHYKNLEDNVRQRMGIILNMFRGAGNKNQNYSEANLTAIEEYTDEEWKAYQEQIIEEAKKAREELEAKKKANGMFGEVRGTKNEGTFKEELDNLDKATRKAKKAGVEKEVNKAEKKD